MFGSKNMLSAKKVKLHGMTTTRWTTADKITQYKGLINLYRRDRKIIETDNVVTRRKLTRELKALQKDVNSDRAELDNAIRGDKQKLRNTLAEYRELQLAYQNSPPQKAIESVDQLNFTKRKEGDKLDYVMKQKSQQLIDLKLQKSVLEDRIKYEIFGEVTKLENEAQIITGKVQDAFLRKEAALAIKDTYAEIIAIMKKDNLYFDSVLDSMTQDGLNQGKCFLNATKLGQLATEYLDDRRQEYMTLEKVVIKDLKSRKMDLTFAQDQADAASQAIKQLIRKDSDINTCDVEVEESNEFITLKLDLKTIENTLKLLQMNIMVPQFEDIYPCLEEQARQKKRLREMAIKCEKNQEILLNKLNHAEVMNNVLKNSMVEFTGEYKQNKRALKSDIVETTEDIRKLKIIIKKRHLLIANITISLRQLMQICRVIVSKNKEDSRSGQSHKGRPNSGGAEDGEVVLPEPEENDGLKIITELNQKLSLLMSHVPDSFTDEQMIEALRNIEDMWRERTQLTELNKTDLDEDALLGDIFTEVSHCLTREDIKRISADIVAANSKNEDLVPVFAMPVKKFNFKK